MKLFNNKKPARILNPLTAELEDARRALEIAYARFENVIDPDLIDCSIYEVNSVMERYKYLLKLAKAADAQLALSEAPDTAASGI